MKPYRKRFTEPGLDLWALPVCVGLVGLAHLILPDFILWYFLKIPFHEFGHAIVSWLGSRAAIPIGAFIPAAGFTISSAERSVPLFCVFAGLMASLGWWGWQEEAPFMSAVAALGLTGLIYFTWLAPAPTWQQAQVFGGILGEFLLGFFFIVAFSYRLPDRLRWDFFRFPFLFAGTYNLLSSHAFWRRIQRGQESMPLGSMMEGPDDANGDLDRLLFEFDWGPKQIIGTCVKLGTLCLVVAAVHYAFSALRARYRE